MSTVRFEEPVCIMPLHVVEERNGALRDAAKRIADLESRLADVSARDSGRTRLLGLPGPAERDVSAPREVAAFLVWRDGEEPTVIETTRAQWAAEAWTSSARS